MKQKIRWAVTAGILALSVVSVSSASAMTEAGAISCDRTCLTDLLSVYIDALTQGDHSKLPLTERFRFTEDSKAMQLGQGLWQSVTGAGQFRQDYIDTAKQVAAAHVEMKEGRNPVLLSIVLHTDEGRISGAETLVQRFNPNSRFQPVVLDKPIKGMNDPIPAGQRQSRESIIRTALTYTEGLRVGNFTDAGTPFADDTYRVENGVVTAGAGCGRDDCGLYTQNIFVHPGIIASVAAVDEENGTVLVWMNFGDTGSYEPGHALITFESFKVWGGKIQSINAFLTTLPQAVGRFWPSSDPIPKL